MDADPERFGDFLLTTLREVDGGLAEGDAVLDVGCGEGEFTETLGRLGYEASGTDFEPLWGEPDPRFRRIERDPYRLPYDDDVFDLVTSVAVLEHVHDIPAFFREVHRVLKPGGRALHFLPGTWTPLEKHIWVPLASRIRSRWWFGLWALAGIRTEHQRGRPWREVMEINHEFAHTGVNYLPRRKMRRLAESEFGNAYYTEQEYVRARLRRFGRLGRLRVPLLGRILFTFNDQLLYTVKQKPAT